MNRYAVLVASGVLALIAIGAYVTSRATAPQMNAHGPLDANLHAGAAILVGALALYFVLRQSDLLAALAGWTFLALFAIQGSAGWMGARILHATLAPLVFAGAVAVVLVGSRTWETSETVDDRTVPLLRPLALAGPPLVLLQTLLGALYRHKLAGVIPHLAGAMIVALTALVAVTLVFQRCPASHPLRSGAKWLMAAVLSQVGLGVAAFAIQLLGVASTGVLVTATTSHVVVGSVTMSASVAFAMQVQRLVRRSSKEASSPPEAGAHTTAGLAPGASL